MSATLGGVNEGTGDLSAFGVTVAYYLYSGQLSRILETVPSC